jgi:hypothetical protein
MTCLFLNSLIMHITLQILLPILGQNKLKKKTISWKNMKNAQKIAKD